MRAKIRAARILSILCLCLGAAVFLLWRYTPAVSGAVQQPDVHEIINIPVGEVTAIAVTNDKASFGVMQKGNVLEVVSPVQGSYDHSQLRTLIYAACHLTGSRKNSDPESWKDYGYGNAQSVVSLFRQDGSVESFTVLMQSPIDQNYYVFSESQQAVYLVSKQDAQLFLRAEKDFFTRSIFPVITAANYGGLESVSLSYGGNGRDYTLEQQGGVFRLTSPIVQRVPTVAALQELLNYISALYSDEFIAENADYSQYNFDNYALKISMTFEGRQHTALLLDEGGDSCLMLNPDSGNLYRVTGSNLALLMRDYLVLLDGKAYNYSVGDLRSLTVTTGGKSRLYEISGQGEELTAAYDDQKLNSAELIALMKVLNGAAIARELSPEETVQGQPVLTLSFTMKSGSVEQVDFIAASQDSYYVRVNQITNFTISAATLTHILEAVTVE